MKLFQDALQSLNALGPFAQSLGSVKIKVDKGARLRLLHQVSGQSIVIPWPAQAKFSKDTSEAVAKHREKLAGLVAEAFRVPPVVPPITPRTKRRK